MITLLDWTLPIHLVSEGNQREHWHKAARRHADQKRAIQLKWNVERPKITLPCTVILTRIAPRRLDDDNLQFSLKYCRDYISDLLIPGLAPGRADGDPRITWLYEQKKGLPKEYALHIKITTQ